MCKKGEREREREREGLDVRQRRRRRPQVVLCTFPFSLLLIFSFGRGNILLGEVVHEAPFAAAGARPASRPEREEPDFYLVISKLNTVAGAAANAK